MRVLKESELIEILQAHTENSFTKELDKNCRHDLFVQGKSYVIELKCRTSHYPTLRIEKDKYEHLMQYDCNRYICSTPVGIFSYNLKAFTEPNWVLRWNPEKTQWGQRVMVLKWVADLPIKFSSNILDKLSDEIKTKFNLNE